MAKVQKNKKVESIRNPELIGFGVSRIRELAFSLNEDLFKPDEKEVIVNYLNKLGHNDAGFVNFRLRAAFVYKNFPDEELFSIEVQNIFEVRDLNKFIDKDKKLLLPGWFLITLVNMSVGHTRAILAKQTAGSIFSDKLLPVVNSTKMATAFFGEEAIKRV
jgi:hypothetical protein